MSETKIVVTGANGQLGKELQQISASYPRCSFIFLSKNDLPIQEPEAVRQFFEITKPSYCINCAAYTAVDKAETERDLAFLINGESVGRLASCCKLVGTKLIHISTDYVFNGNSCGPLKEEDITSPINVYGASKLKGEELAFQNNEDKTIVVRTSWLYSTFGNNFVKTMIRLMNERASIDVIRDQTGSPTYGRDLAKLIVQIIVSNKFIAGIYHYSNQGEISWYDFAMAIGEIIHSNCKINSISSSQYNSAAKRPLYSVLDTTKIRSVYGIEIPGWKSSLISCIDRLKEGV
jgi:dTDP-4-dehydrorhamnose reductase